MEEKEQYKTTRIWTKTHRLLKMIAGTQGISIVELLDRLANEELQRMKERGTITNFP